MKFLTQCKTKVHKQGSVAAGREAQLLPGAIKSYSTALQLTVHQNTIPPCTHPVRAEQACVRQSLFPILLMQSLNAVLMSGIDRQVCKGNQKRACVLCNKRW